MTKATSENRNGHEDLAARMRFARAYAGLGQAAVAERLGVSRATVSAWERGYTPIPTIARVGIVEGLADVSGLPESFFLEGGE